MLKGIIGKLTPFPMREAGAVLNAKNKAAITRAYRELRTALKNAGVDPDIDDDTNAKESAANVIEAGNFSVADLSILLQTALNPDTRTGEYEQRRIVDLFDDRLIYQENWSGPFYAVTYTVTDSGLVQFGTPELVIRKVDYISPAVSTLEANEAGDLAFVSEPIPLVEAAVNDNGETHIKLIAPGWGSSGYYPADVLQRDGPLVFRAGTKMFWDHPTPAEEAARPEGTLDRWAATLTEDAYYDVNGVNGAGLYARADVRTDYRQPVNDLAPKGLGVSIRASGRARVGDVGGKRGPIIETITGARSVDFVTTAGAGGSVLALFEAARNRGSVINSDTGIDPVITHGENTMPFSDKDREEIAAIVSAAVSAAVAPLQEANNALRDASDRADAERIVMGRLNQMRQIPPTVRQRIAPDIARLFERDANGAIDTAKLIEATNARAADEIRYLASVGARGVSGAVDGFGDSAPLNEASNAANGDGFETVLAETFARWGHTADEAKIAARGRAR